MRMNNCAYASILHCALTTKNTLLHDARASLFAVSLSPLEVISGNHGKVEKGKNQMQNGGLGSGDSNLTEI